MKAFLFLSRVGFLLNLLFLVCLVLRLLPAELLPQSIVSFLLIGGWLLSFFVNAVLQTLLLVLYLKGERQFQMPAILVFNLVILIFQFIYFFLL